MPIDGRYLHTLVVKRLVATPSSSAEVLGGPDTTLVADVPVASSSIEVADPTGIVDGQYLRIGDVGEFEIRQVADGGVAGDVVTLATPTSLDHDSGDQVRQVDGAGEQAVDEYGQPIESPVIVATVRGLIQPRSAREIPLSTGEGAAISDHVAYMAPLAGLATDCWIEHDGNRYDVLTTPDAAGLGHHLELGLRRVA